MTEQDFTDLRHQVDRQQRDIDYLLKQTIQLQKKVNLLQAALPKLLTPEEPSGQEKHQVSFSGPRVHQAATAKPPS